MSKAFIDFRSDNTGRAAPELIEALAAANTGTSLGYGGDETTAALQKRFSALFEIPVRVYPVATGTAANAISLAAIANPFGAVYCAREAHIDTSECNATAFFSGGAKMVPVAGTDGKIAPEALDAAVANAGVGQTHKSQPAAINIVQATDMGAVYSVDEVAAIGRVAAPAASTCTWMGPGLPTPWHVSAARRRKSPGAPVSTSSPSASPRMAGCWPTP